MDPRIIPTSAFAGQALWQHLALEALNEGAGVLPGSVLSDWRQVIVDRKATLTAVADSLGLCHESDAVPGNDLFVCIIRILYLKDHGVATGFVAALLRPASNFAKAANAPRLRAVEAASPLPRQHGRTMDVLDALQAANKRAIEQLAREDNPYSVRCPTFQM
ncbi:hypothetical protein B0H13DRAFT_2662219 [Mycena leptocephala]|nr:hypothetical protein B0H13DRAFT_2662219 [Mycena leptocephala]